MKSLCFIVKHGSLRESAKRSFLTPAAVSLQIKGLEQELGVKIFEIKGRKLALTARGEVFYHEAQKVLEAVHEASDNRSRGEWLKQNQAVARVLFKPNSRAVMRVLSRERLPQKNLSLRPEMEASTCMEVKRYVANSIGAGIVHDICLDPEGSSRFRTISLENIIFPPRARLVYNPSKTLTPSEKKFIEFIRFAS